MPCRDDHRDRVASVEPFASVADGGVIVGVPLDLDTAGAGLETN
jgi:hypothetical protein